MSGGFPRPELVRIGGRADRGLVARPHRNDRHQLQHPASILFAADGRCACQKDTGGLCTGGSVSPESRRGRAGVCRRGGMSRLLDLALSRSDAGAGGRRRRKRRPMSRQESRCHPPMNGCGEPGGDDRDHGRTGSDIAAALALQEMQRVSSRPRRQHIRCRPWLVAGIPRLGLALDLVVRSRSIHARTRTGASPKPELPARQSLAPSPSFHVGNHRCRSCPSGRRPAGKPGRSLAAQGRTRSSAGGSLRADRRLLAPTRKK